VLPHLLQPSTLACKRRGISGLLGVVAHAHRVLLVLAGRMRIGQSRDFAPLQVLLVPIFHLEIHSIRAKRLLNLAEVNLARHRPLRWSDFRLQGAESFPSASFCGLPSFAAPAQRQTPAIIVDLQPMPK
jgi:hypothetical protein